MFNSPQWISSQNLSCCLLTTGDFFIKLLQLPGRKYFLIVDVYCVSCVVRRTSELAGRAPLAAFCARANWELVWGFGHLLCPCKEGISAGAKWKAG